MKKIQLLLIFLLSFAFSAKSQIVYFDINPDLNGAAVQQAVLGTTFTFGVWAGGNAFATDPYGVLPIVMITGVNDNIAILNQGDMIGPASNWNVDAWNNSGPGTYTDKYLGFRVGTPANFRYGWFKVTLTFATGGNTWVVKSYGYQNTPNTAIAAGDMGAPAVPVAAFSGNPLTGQTNITNITFTDASTNTPTSWAWSFTPNNVSYQNGTTAASQNPVVKFTAAGTYSATLVATNAAGNNTHVKPNYITISNPPAPATEYTANNLNPTTNTSTVTFTDQTANVPTTWAWTFSPNTVIYQNGTSAASQNPQVQFTTAGTYTVKLKTTNAFGSDSLIKPNYITASVPQAPAAAFIGNPLTGISNATTINLTDQSLHSPTSWQWTVTPNNVTYQGGTTASSQNPSMRFTQAGLYTIKLKVTNALGTDSLTKTNYITITTAPPDAQFTSNATTGNATQTLFTLTDQSTNGPTSWQWSFTPNTVTFANGTTATSQNPQVTFDAVGVYAVKLIAANSGGSDSLTKTNYITIVPGVFKPTASFKADTLHAVPDQTIVSFTDLSENLPTSWYWTITPNTFTYQNNGNATVQNPKLIFNVAGNYTIKLKATNALGSDSMTKTAYIVVGGGATGITETTDANKILKVYPNPANNYLNFETQQGIEIEAVTIVNLEGKVIATYSEITNNSINISGLTKGMYFTKIEFKNESRAEFKKFSKL